MKFTQVFNTYCNADKSNFRLEYSLTDRNIEIREIFDADMVARCICPLRIEGQIYDLTEGKYYIQFIFDNINTRQIAIIEELEIVLE